MPEAWKVMPHLLNGIPHLLNGIPHLLNAMPHMDIVDIMDKIFVQKIDAEPTHFVPSVPP